MTVVEPLERIERASTQSGFTTVVSPVLAVADVIEMTGIDASKPHCFAGVRFFTDSGGATPATPTEGTVTIAVLSICTDPAFQAPPTPVIQAAAVCDITWAANTTTVRATPADIVGAAYYQLVVTCNET